MGGTDPTAFGVAPVGLLTHRPLASSPSVQQHSSRRAIAADDAQRQADEIVGAWLHVPQVESLQDHDSRLQQRVMSGAAFPCGAIER